MKFSNDKINVKKKVKTHLKLELLCLTIQHLPQTLMQTLMKVI